MKNAIISFALIASSSPAFANEPKETLAAFQVALASGDREKAAELLAPDITIYESGYVERSRAEYAEHHMAGDMALAKTATHKVLRQSERRDGNLSVIWEETETNATVKGKVVRYLGTSTALLQKTGDIWTIVHVHWSSRKPK